MPVRHECFNGSGRRECLDIGGHQYNLQHAPGTVSFYDPASDGVVTSTVAATLSIGDYSVSITPSSRIVLQNTTASYTVNVTSIDNYSGNLTGTCGGIPSPAVCSVNGFFAGWTASIQTNNLAVGNYSFTVELSNGAATRSASAQLIIGDFNATLSGNSLSVGVGQSGNITVNVTGQNGFADAVALACNGAPTGTTCAVNPASVIPSSGGAPAAVTGTVSTKPAMKNSRQSKTAGARAGIVGISSPFFGLLAVLTLGRRKAESLCASIALLALIAVVASCGGGASSGGGGGGGGGGGSAKFSVTVQASADGVTKNVGTVTVTVP